MDDGGMGSLHLSPRNSITSHRVFGMMISEFQFIDKDGITVVASLNVDNEGNLFELDLWKTDYSKLIEFPVVG